MTPAGSGPCGAVHRKRSVVSTRSRPSARVIQPRSMPTPYAVSPKPMAATLENDSVGQRSGTRPFAGFARSRKKLNVRCWSESRNASSPSGGVTGVVRGSAHAGRSSSTRTRAWRARMRSRWWRGTWPCGRPRDRPHGYCHSLAATHAEVQPDLQATAGIRRVRVRRAEVVDRTARRPPQRAEAPEVRLVEDVDRFDDQPDAALAWQEEVLLQAQIHLAEVRRILRVPVRHCTPRAPLVR